jgi:hypothetical protein
LKKAPNRQTRLTALARESERALRELIHRRLKLPPEKRTHFLRKRIGVGRTAF